MWPANRFFIGNTLEFPPFVSKLVVEQHTKYVRLCFVKISDADHVTDAEG